MKSLDDLKKASLLEIVDIILKNRALRALALRVLSKKAYKALVIDDPHGLSLHTREGRYHLVCGLIKAIVRAVDEGLICNHMRRVLARNFVRALVEQNKDEHRREFIDRHGFEPPLLMVISPEGRCNLACYGCYANSTSELSHLDYETVDRMMREKRDFWGSRFTVISGGEPFLWNSNGKGILDLIEEHNDQVYQMYTNGTLITKEVAKRLAQAGNLSPAISVEGFEKETAARRGKTAFKRILQAMDNLSEAGVPFGLSITATKMNADVILSDEMIDFYFNKHGALYAWIFQYMPIGRKIDLELLITPEQRVTMLKQMEKLVWERDLFIVDFWNSGPYTFGCIAAGRGGGYFYVDWNGNVAPCVFFPYSNYNIYDVYAKGGDLNTVLFSPLFKKIRHWQSDYGFLTGEHCHGNQLAPCPYRDHYGFAYEAIVSSGAKAIDASADDAIHNPGYREQMIEYGQKIQELMTPIWKEEFLASGIEEPAKSEKQV